MLRMEVEVAVDVPALSESGQLPSQTLGAFHMVLWWVFWVIFFESGLCVRLVGGTFN